MELHDCDADIIEPDWKKVERDMAKVGIKNGLSDGRDSNFQKSFDKGYEDGFRNGFELGMLKFQRDNHKNTLSKEISELLQNANKGMCVVCATEKDNENVADIRKKQSEFLTSSIEKINAHLKCDT